MVAEGDYRSLHVVGDQLYAVGEVTTRVDLATDQTEPLFPGAPVPDAKDQASIRLYQQMIGRFPIESQSSQITLVDACLRQVSDGAALRYLIDPHAPQLRPRPTSHGSGNLSIGLETYQAWGRRAVNVRPYEAILETTDGRIIKRLKGRVGISDSQPLLASFYRGKLVCMI